MATAKTLRKLLPKDIPKRNESHAVLAERNPSKLQRRRISSACLNCQKKRIKVEDFCNSLRYPICYWFVYYSVLVKFHARIAEPRHTNAPTTTNATVEGGLILPSYQSLIMLFIEWLLPFGVEPAKTSHGWFGEFGIYQQMRRPSKLLLVGNYLTIQWKGERSCCEWRGIEMLYQVSMIISRCGVFWISLRNGRLEKVFKVRERVILYGNISQVHLLTHPSLLFLTTIKC